MTPPWLDQTDLAVIQCHCGNVLNAGSVPAANECTFSCGGGDGETCGADNRLNVYRIGPEPPAPSTA